MIPSGIQRSKELPLRLQQVRPGLYVVKNAYAGIFQFFAMGGDRMPKAAGSTGEHKVEKK